MKVLIVDDNDSVLELLRKLVAAAGHEVVTASNGAEALKMARLSPPGLVITDVLMPVLDGFALARAWRQDNRLKTVPVVVYTAVCIDQNAQELALGLGADRFIVRLPDDPDAFCSDVREAVEQLSGEQLTGTPSVAADSDPGIASQMRKSAAPCACESNTMAQYSPALVSDLERIIHQLHKTKRDLEKKLKACRHNLPSRHAEESLRESEQRHRTLIEESPDTVGILQEGEVVFMNPSGAQALGYGTPQEMIGLKVERLIHPDDLKSALDRVRRRLAGETGLYPAEVRYLRVDGTVVPAEVVAAPVLFDGQLAVQFVARDITDRKRAEKEREKLQEQLLRMHKMESVGRLAGGVAHDFNNMLQAILGNAALAMAQAPQGSDLQQHIAEIEKAASRSAELTRQLLAFARKQTIRPRVLDLNETVCGMLSMLKGLLGEDIALAWVPGKDLWRVKVDPAQIDRVLANLAVNARDAIEGVGKVTIETANVRFDQAYASAHPECAPGDYVMLAVTDTGRGIDEGARPHIFEPFFTTKAVGRGTGLGLATVFGIVKQNRGLLNVYSEPGHGAAFKVYLPRAEADPSLPVKSISKHALRGNETVLLVEDEEQILNISRLVLEGHGYTVLAALTPEVALNMAATHRGPIHLLVTDIVMPGMNGKELQCRLAAIHPHVKCLFMSGYTSNVIVRHGISAGDAEFLQKPFAVGVLAEKVRQVLDQRP